MSIFNKQMEFGRNNGYNNEIFWDLLSEDQSYILKDKIKTLIPDQRKENEDDLKNADEHEKIAIEEFLRKSKKNAVVERMRENIFTSVWAQRKYTNKNSLSSIIFVLVTKEANLELALLSKEFSCHPVFRTRKCVAQSDSTQCCMVFIDENGRVYRNWDAYLSDNVLPKGTMVAPTKGYYTFKNVNGKEIVNLQIRPTPASSVASKVIEVADTTSAITGFLAAGVSIAALCTLPVTAPLLAGATAVGLASGGYSAVRSGSNLVDRRNHEQSISLTDRQARGSWLGVIGGVVGLGASRATRVLTTAAAAGTEVSMVTTLVVNGMNISSIVLSGSGVANGILDMILKYNDDEEITTMDALQLAASLVLFTHSVSNFRLASNIFNEAQSNKIQSYRDGLSRRQRKMFDKMTRETIRIKGPNQARMDVIRSVNEIPTKQYLNDLHKINRQLNKQKVRPSFGGPKAPVLLNNDLPIDTKVLRDSVQHKIGADVLSQVKQPIPETHTKLDSTNINYKPGGPMPSRLLINENTNFNENFYGGSNRKSASAESPYYDIVKKLMQATFALSSGATMSFAELGSSLFEHVINAECYQDAVVKLAKDFPDKTFRLLVNLAKTFIETSLLDIEEMYNIKIPRELVFVQLQKIISKYKTVSHDFLNDKSCEILKELRSYFRNKKAQNNTEHSESYTSDAIFIFLNNQSSNDSVASLMTASIQLSCGAIVSLAANGQSFFDNIINVGSFQDVTLNMGSNFSELTFCSMINLANTFIEMELPEIHKTLKTHISTEDILYRMLSHCLKTYPELNHEILNQECLGIMETLRVYYISLNPNNDLKNLTKCEYCDGGFFICKL